MHSCEQDIFSSQIRRFTADTGYFRTPLIKRLGIKLKMEVILKHEPEAYEWPGVYIFRVCELVKKRGLFLISWKNYP